MDDHRTPPAAGAQAHEGLPLRHYLMLALGGTLIVALLASTHWQYSLSIDTMASLRHQHERLRQVDTLMIRMLDAETGARGYIASGDTAHLEPYQKSVPDIVPLLKTLRTGAQDDAELRALAEEIDTAVAKKLRILAAAVAAGKGEIWSIETAGAGKVVMDQVRDLIDRFKRLSESRAEESIARSTAAIGFSRWLAVALGLAAIALLVSLHDQTRRQLQLRARIDQILREENERLDREVAHRTSELANMARYLSDVREQEKRRLARELHDELGAILTSAKIDSGWIARKLDPTAMGAIRERFDRIVSQLNNGIALKRRIIDNLTPPLLEELGLVASLQSMFDEARVSTSMKIEFDEPTSVPDLPLDKALALFRIAQESLTNVRKYAKARTVRIALAFEPSAVRLSIEDDGQGFDPDTVTGTHGIAGMRYRTRTFGGSFEIRSSPGKGARVEARIPL